MTTKFQLLSQLKKSLWLLQRRRDVIPKYVNQDQNWTGKNHYSLDMIPQLDFQIAEMKAAIEGIEAWKKEHLKNNRKKS